MFWHFITQWALTLSIYGSYKFTVGFDAVIKSTKMGPTDVLQPEQRVGSLNLSVATTCYILVTLSITRLHVSHPTDISNSKLLVNSVFHPLWRTKNMNLNGQTN